MIRGTQISHFCIPLFYKFSPSSPLIFLFPYNFPYKKPNKVIKKINKYF